MDRFAATKHGQEFRDLRRTLLGGLCLVNPIDNGVAIRRVQSVEHLTNPWIIIQRCLQISVGSGRALRCVRGFPSPVRFCRVNLRQPLLCHLAGHDQPLGAFTVYFRPSALWFPWRETRLEVKLIYASQLPINPTMREGKVYGVRLANCCLCRPFLGEF